MSTTDLTGIPRFEDPVYLFRGFPFRLLMRYKDSTGTAYNLTGYTGRFVFRADDGTFATGIEANTTNGYLTFPGSVTATGNASLSGGGVSTVTLVNEGNGYATPPLVTFSGGGGTGAAAVANLVNGYVGSVVVTAPGTGYGSAPAVTIGPPDGQPYNIQVNIPGSATLNGAPDDSYDGVLILTEPSGYSQPFAANQVYPQDFAP